MTSTAVHPELTASPPAPRPSFRQRLATRRLIHRARVAERDARLARVDAEVGSRVDAWDRWVSA